MDFFASAPLLLNLADPRAVDASLTGAKAANLARARTAGLPVLDGFVLTTRGRPSPRALSEAWRALSRHGTRTLVVRSSSVAEDGSTSAMAGRFRSVLGVDSFDAFRAAVDEVLASAAGVGGAPAPMAVLVQPELDCACGGVMFGLDPSSGDVRRLVVEVVPGGPDGLVSGRATASRLVLSRRGRRVSVEGETTGLGHGRRLWLAKLARSTERCFGGAQDVEWAVDQDGSGWLLLRPALTSYGRGRDGSRPARRTEAPGLRGRRFAPGDPGQRCFPGARSRADDRSRTRISGQSTDLGSPPMPDDQPGDVLDAERLADLQQLGPERFARLAETFISSVWTQVDEIERAAAAGDASAVRRTAHSLKGSSRIYGAYRVADIAESLEDGAPSAMAADGDGRVARLRDEVAAAVAALHELTGD